MYIHKYHNINQITAGITFLPTTITSLNVAKVIAAAIFFYTIVGSYY